MTLPASYSEPLQSELPTVREKESANQLRKILSAHQKPGEPITINARLDQDDSTSTKIVLSPKMAQFLISLLRIIGRGSAVTLVPVSEELSTKQAADILNVSRPHFVKLLEAKKIPFHKVGRHRRVDANDLFAYKGKMQEQKLKALDEIANIDSKYL